MIRKTMRRAAAAGIGMLLTAGSLSAMPAISVLAAGNIVINEVCTKNTTAAASDGQFYDYVELYNTSGSSVSVGGFGLSDDPADPMRYTIPSGTSIAAHGYLTVYCGITAESGVQGAEFGLSKSGETILLSGSNGSLLESQDVPALADDTSYGRVPDGSDTYAVLSKLTPGSSNSAGAVQQIVVPEPTFSQESGFYSSGFFRSPVHRAPRSTTRSTAAIRPLPRRGILRRCRSMTSPRKKMSIPRSLISLTITKRRQIRLTRQ